MNSFGTLFRISIFGESHGKAIGVAVDGCPPGIALEPEDFLPDLRRRKSGASGTTKRHEPDLPEVLSGLYGGFTTGSPMTIMTWNQDKISSDYDEFFRIPRPGHADFTSTVKYSGFSDRRGSGHFSGRITWGLVVAGVVAKRIAATAGFSAKLISAGGSSDIEGAVRKAVQENDSIGGIIECVVSNVPAGLGEPFFNSVESVISHLVFSVPAVRGIEFGSGFSAASMRGSEHNDPFTDDRGSTSTNNAGGINGGITNGNDIVFRVAIKPASSIGVAQTTFNFNSKKMDTLEVKGRHDTCIALRIPVVIEAAAAIAVADLMQADRGIYNAERKTRS
ncbi:MAG TPA: chorismate synthase [Bacteroidales bacterium]|jgi:chorismate synthase|nr:chorismate synthase [Bacteroidales bacterium]HOS72553.1 chorismate synthase [Bacteroidales bacterium]HQH25340.1 chorismate synthase [Bacteroidales bacterium]